MAESGNAGRGARTARGLWVHRAALLRGLGVLLLIVVVLQNVEPTSIDLLFWSVSGVPKLLVILGGMIVGAVVWELAKRALRPGARGSPGGGR